MKTVNKMTISAVCLSSLMLSGAANAMGSDRVMSSDRGEMWYGDTPATHSAPGTATAMPQKVSYTMSSDRGEMWFGDEPAKQQPKDIVDIAMSAGNFSTLLVAVKEAGLVDTLKGEGPFTVFAPTDEAFAKIPAEQLQALLEDKEALTAVLTYHVVPGKVLAEDVVALNSATTVQGSDIDIDTSNGVRVDSAQVVATDIVASNGVIHVIDTVIMPQSSAQL